MRTLVVAATPGELAALEADPRVGHTHVDVLVTGVGMVATAARVARALALHSYDAALNVGVCGTFDRRLALGTVVHVTADCLAELGVEDGPVFVPAHALGLIPGDEPPYSGGRLLGERAPASATLDGLPRVSGITVNTVHGDEATIAAVVNRCHPEVESMEGAAFMYACLVAGVPFAQVRAVSNYVERRNRAAWSMTDAIAAVGRSATAILREWA